MKFFIVLVALFAVALAAPPASAPAEILNLESEVGPEDFSYAFSQSDGIQAQAKGHLDNVGSDHESLQVSGSYSFIGDDGQTYTVNYVANEGGFQPTGAHLPVAPQA